ncbi:MAG: ATP-binding protein [Bacteroidales bacterium]
MISSNSDDINGGFAILCDENGVIKKVLNGITDITENITGRLFTNLIDKDTRSKAMDFLLDLKDEDIAMNYQMNVWVNDNIKTLSFIGIRIKQEMIIIGARNEEEAVEFTNHLQQINNEQANTIRKLVKEKYQYKKIIEKQKDQTYDDLTSLNNELINLQRELSKKNAELERINDTKNQILGMAAHDLRNPLSVIQSYTQYLIERSDSYLPEKQKKFLNTIYSTSQFMLNLIDDILDVSKIESGKLHLNKQSTEITELILNNVELNKPLAAKKNISINLNIKIQPVKIDIDAHKIEQVFNNLITNAIKFSYPNTSIDVCLKRIDDNMLHFSFHDQGVGIKAEKLESIFQPFTKESSRGTEGEPGTGLGLVIVKQIVEGHGGKIWVDSTVNKGSCFCFTLPLEHQYKTETNGKDTYHPYNLSDKTILLIEDHSISKKLIIEMLKSTGVKIITSYDGKEGITHFENHPEIDLILLDLSLPDMDGLDVIKHFRKSHKEIPIIIQTAHVVSGEKEKALLHGANDYITKPIESKTLYDTLKKYLIE